MIGELMKMMNDPDTLKSFAQFAEMSQRADKNLALLIEKTNEVISNQKLIIAMLSDIHVRTSNVSEDY